MTLHKDPPSPHLLNSTTPVYQRMRQNWLTSKPNSLGPWVAALFTILLMLCSLIYWNDLWHASQWMSATHQKVFNQHEIWRAWSTLFVHGDGKHLFSNLFFFFIFATLINGYFGKWAFPMMAFVFGGLINLIVLQDMPHEVHLIGASGIVFWMGGFWLALSFFIDRRRSLLHRGLKFLGISLVLFFPSEAFDPNISYAAHFVGFALGLLSGSCAYLIFRKIFSAKEQIEIIDENLDQHDAPSQDPFLR